MKKYVYFLVTVLFVAAFVVAGTVFDASLFAAGAAGVIVAEAPLLVRGISDQLKDVTANSNELKQRQAGLIKELEGLLTKKVSEFTEEERNLWTKKMPELDAVSSQLRLALEQEQIIRMKAGLEGADLSKGDKRDIARYSFRKAILSQLQGRTLDGIEAEMHQEALKEAKANGLGELRGIGVPYLLLSRKPLSRASTGQNVTTAADGGYLIQEEPLLYFEALRNKLLLPGMGARLLTGLVGDLPLIEGGSFTASWLAEDTTDTTTKVAFDELLMQPKRLQATGALSMQLLRQASLDVEKLVEDMLVAAHAQGLQTAAINGSGTAPEPRGILNKAGIGSVVGGTNGLAPAWSHIIGLETEVSIDNADGPSMAYLTNAKVRGKLKQVEKAASTGQFVWVGNEVNGYPGYVTNAVPSDLDKGTSTDVCSAIIFGDFSKLFIGQWGNLDIIVDPFSLKKKAEIEVTVISYGDIGILQPEGFAAMKDALTT